MSDKYKVGDRLFCTHPNEDPESEAKRPTKNRWCTIMAASRGRGRPWSQYLATFGTAPSTWVVCIGDFELRRADPRLLLVLP